MGAFDSSLRPRFHQVIKSTLCQTATHHFQPKIPTPAHIFTEFNNSTQNPRYKLESNNTTYQPFTRDPTIIHHDTGSISRAQYFRRITSSLAITHHTDMYVHTKGKKKKTRTTHIHPNYNGSGSKTTTAVHRPVARLERRT